MRFFGLGAKTRAKLGVATQLLAPGDIFQALQLGIIDATEFSLPVTDQKLPLGQPEGESKSPAATSPAM